MSDSTCTIEGCDRKHKARGWCELHYGRWRFLGTPLGDPRQPNHLANRAMVSEDGRSKNCVKCGELKPMESFALCRSNQLGRRMKCKKCRSDENRALYQANPERLRERSLWGAIKAKYGLTRAQFEHMERDQGYVCAICGGLPLGRVRVNQNAGPRLVIDHDHQTGKVRGLLCTPCNLAIGYLRDNPRVVDMAAVYLRRSLEDGDQ